MLHQQGKPFDFLFFVGDNFRNAAENTGQSSIAALKTILETVMIFGSCFFVRFPPFMLDFIDRIGYNYSRKKWEL